MRLLKVSALLVAAYLVLFLIELAGLAPPDAVDAFARQEGMAIDAEQRLTIGGAEVTVVVLSNGDREVLATVDTTRGYRSRMRVTAFYERDLSAAMLVVDRDAESVLVERVLPRRPESLPLVLDALSGATVTADAIDASMRRSYAAIRRFREGPR